jgi:hypothetical protein
MGWLISHDFTKEEQVADLVKGWEREGKGTKCIAHSVRGNVLYGVYVPTVQGVEGTEAERFIMVILLRKDLGYGWGYKDMAEEMGPFKYDCPLKYLAMAPTVRCQEWRDGVLANASRKKATKIEPGCVIRFASGYKDCLGNSLNGVESKILRKQGRGYIAELGGMTIKIMRRHVGEVLIPA